MGNVKQVNELRSFFGVKGWDGTSQNTRMQTAHRSAVVHSYGLRHKHSLVIIEKLRAGQKKSALN